ncbi:MAG: transaldolase, partial [Burkholderiaceae bacterium]|nr:transaldolase [Burkholderiaceae bacterium]
MPSLLEGLSRHTVIVADTGDIDAVERWRPQDATTNPTLILRAASVARYRSLVRAAAQRAGPLDEKLDSLLVAFGVEILRRIPGRVSTEVDARLSFDTQGTIQRARRLVALYEEQGIDRSRVLIKIASTWEGIRAAEVLEAEGIRCNMTLLFSVVQAEAAAAAGATLISPFVGRIYDWHKRAAGSSWDESAHAGVNDPGVRSVREIYARLKGAGCRTQIMGASFRNIGQILALAGCDLLTISPELLAQLQASDAPLPRRLDVEAARRASLHALTFNEPALRWA